MRNFKITIQYEGTRYQGWQRQDSTNNTIQGKFETILAKMTGLDFVQVDGSGRTDAGVHAFGQVANFKIDTNMTAKEIMSYINQYLPEDIGVIAIQEMPERFHSRLNAKGKTYNYRIWNTELPCIFARRYVYEMPEELQLEAMRTAAAYLIGKHDFKAFTSNKKSKKSTVRTINTVQIDRNGSEVVITYSGDGFLYHMVRILTGTLIEVGLGQRAPASMQVLLEKDATRDMAGMLVPAKGLCLMEVQY
ncbi:MAG: tRNA pseudouridine(38-40) synthase TruA [Lachnospiraceae bacterium]|jgi:tRNA pseudouridine38-40 synthase|nr:tRNA pseudouridine(38-40) synthase TruA [Lachnospiraceae bacterium]HBV85053.1 tRNA pseudouridine(38-40) synthase TruA [Lachnospiraceae bacterium]